LGAIEVNYPDKTITVDGLEDDRYGMVRIGVSDAYSEFVPPPYREDGAYILSLIPNGQIGRLVFFKEDPESIFVISRPMIWDADDDAIVAAARSIMRKGMDSAASE
jgi:hypothetical protein